MTKCGKIIAQPSGASTRVPTIRCLLTEDSLSLIRQHNNGKVNKKNRFRQLHLFRWRGTMKLSEPRAPIPSGTLGLHEALVTFQSVYFMLPPNPWRTVHHSALAFPPHNGLPQSLFPRVIIRSKFF